MTLLQIFYAWGYVWMFFVLQGMFAAVYNLLKSKDQSNQKISEFQVTHHTGSPWLLLQAMLLKIIKTRGFYNLLWLTAGMFTPLWAYFMFIWITVIPTAVLIKQQTDVKTYRINALLSGVVKAIVIYLILHYGDVGFNQFI